MIQNKHLILFFLIIFVASASTILCDSDTYRIEQKYREPSYLSLTLTPGASLPLGDERDDFKFGGGVLLRGEYELPYRKPHLFLLGDMGYNLLPIKAETSLSILTIGTGGGVSFYIGERIVTKAFMSGGFFYGFLNDGTGPGGSNPYILGGANIGYFITPKISIGAGLNYNNYFGLYNNMGIIIGSSYHIPAKKERSLKDSPRLTPFGKKQIIEPELYDVNFETIFPVFFKYYDDLSIGRGILRNKEKHTMTDIEVKLFIKQYMDNPKVCTAPTELKKGEEAEVQLNALFNNSVLEITEGTKVSAEITIDFTINDKRYATTKSETIRLHNRNAITWEDDRRAAAFVTAKDPAIMKFAKNVAGSIKGQGSRAIPENLRFAVALHEAYSLYGMSYVVDPTTPYTEFSKNKQNLDYLQFPKQSLEYRAGDCDDLSILYCALLESVGIETAFITIPGHIYMAFFTGIMPEEAKEAFSNYEDLIFLDERAWIPVEVTEIDNGFFYAWHIGSKQWREHTVRGQARFYPIHSAWDIYEPVGSPGGEASIIFPDSKQIVSAYLRELGKYIEKELYPQVAKLEVEIKESGESVQLINKLGVLYARYGQMQKAEEEFNRALNRDETYVPALLNLGNLHYLKKEMQRALSLYLRADSFRPNNPKILLCVARVYHELENYSAVTDLYGTIKELDPDLADRFAYLDLRKEEAVRASEASKVKEEVLWELE